ncbi:MAG: hypothetical protein KIS30_03550 [Thermoplasmata archaeon]|nr:hypothetical protein [Candidatus Sysuiplasma acidicola]MBX8645819.1 hypothetical protein [Candidatus Sysuiplasma acidicola]MDH2905662.1 hypothetical protein [Methanomassiliicoccales archaeon]
MRNSRTGCYTMMAVGVIGMSVSLVAANLITAVASAILALVGVFSLGN